VDDELRVDSPADGSRVTPSDTGAAEKTWVRCETCGLNAIVASLSTVATTTAGKVRYTLSSLMTTGIGLLQSVLRVVEANVGLVGDEFDGGGQAVRAGGDDDGASPVGGEGTASSRRCCGAPLQVVSRAVDGDHAVGDDHDRSASSSAPPGTAWWAGP
jgi:hypothetical protein